MNIPFKDEAESLVEDIKEQAESFVDDIKEAVEDVKETIENAIEGSSSEEEKIMVKTFFQVADTFFPRGKQVSPRGKAVFHKLRKFKCVQLFQNCPAT